MKFHYIPESLFCLLNFYYNTLCGQYLRLKCLRLRKADFKFGNCGTIVALIQDASDQFRYLM